MRAWPVLLVLLLPLWAGCLGGGDGDGNDDGDPVPANLIIRILQVPPVAFVDSDLRIQWAVGVDQPVEVEVPFATLFWSSSPVPVSALSTDAYEASSSPVPPFQAPTNFTTTLVFDEAGTFHMRAYATLQDEEYWSEEWTFEVLAEPGTIHDIVLRGVGPAATPDPDPLTMRPGDGVRWINEDPVAEHAMTSVNSPQRFTTGALAPGDQSEVVVLLEPGEYNYIDELNAATVRGQIIVQA